MSTSAISSTNRSQNPLAIALRASINAFSSQGKIGKIFHQRCLYQGIRTTLIGTTALGAGVTVLACIAGVPGAIVGAGVVVVSSAAGAYSAHKADRHFAEAQNAGAIQRQAEELGRRNQEYARQTNILTAQNANLTANNNRFAAENANLATNVNRLTAENVNLTANVHRFETENANLTANVNRLTTQVTNLQGNINQFALQNENYRQLYEQVRTGNVQNQEEFRARLADLTQHLAASREVWDEVSQEHTTQTAQLRELVAQLVDPRNMLRLQELQEINRHIQAATAQLNQLGLQIARSEGEVVLRDQFLTELRAAHQGILEIYAEGNRTLGARNVDLGAQINRLNALLNVFAAREEITVNYDVGYGNTLGIRIGPFWQETTAWRYEDRQWKGFIPVAKPFKFVSSSRNGTVRWETGSNRIVYDRNQAQREIDARRVVF